MGLFDMFKKEEKVEKIQYDGEINIKVLGSGCRNCMTLESNVKKALFRCGLEGKVEKVKDFNEISSYGVITTPGLVLNEKVVSYGKVLSPENIIEILKKELV